MKKNGRIIKNQEVSTMTFKELMKELTGETYPSEVISQKLDIPSKKKECTLLITVGIECFPDRVGITFKNQINTIGFLLQKEFPKTMPFSGTELEVVDIEKLIEFLQETLREINEDGKGDLE